MFDLTKRPNVQIGLTMDDFCSTSKKVNVPVAAIRAVDEIESAGSGFLKLSQRPKILFEGHVFYHLLAPLGHAADAQNIDRTICYPKWTKEFYIGGEGEYRRLENAIQICGTLGVSENLALQSDSWGRYQIMGNNFRSAGYMDLMSFLEDNFLDERRHLLAFSNFIVNTFLDDELRNFMANPLKYASSFALHYNGNGYKRNQYDVKIANAFEKFHAQNVDCSTIAAADGHVITVMPGETIANPSADSIANTSLDDRHLNRVLKLGMQGDDVKAIQHKLIERGILPNGADDGNFGVHTEQGMILFQKANALAPDGKVGHKSFRRLFI